MLLDFTIKLRRFQGFSSQVMHTQVWPEPVAELEQISGRLEWLLPQEKVPRPWSVARL